MVTERSSPSRLRFAALGAALTAPGRSENLSAMKEWGFSGPAPRPVFAPSDLVYPLKTRKTDSKRQARRTVELYNKYRNKVHFVVVDLDVKRSPEQQQLVKQYYQGSIPHVLVLDANAKPLYNSAGEIDSKHIEAVFAQSFDQSAAGTK